MHKRTMRGKFRKELSKRVKLLWRQPGFRKKMADSKNTPEYKKKRSDENHHNWKGDDVGYLGLHKWVYRKLGQPNKCGYCGKDGLNAQRIHWANKSGKYKRDISDWIRLCRKCHAEYDKC